MNRFVIVGGLPYLLANGKTYAVRWDRKGFTVGAEVKLASVPSVTHGELAVLAKCANHLDSISGMESEKQQETGDQQKTEGQQETGDQQPDVLEGMTVAQLKEYAAAQDIDISKKTRKDDILAAIKQANEKDVMTDDSDGR